MKIYLTGVSGSGKTTLLDRVCSLESRIYPISYSASIREYIKGKKEMDVSLNELRLRSDEIVSAGMISDIDNRIATEVVMRSEAGYHVVLDSHAVSFEKYGFRVLSFTQKVLRAIDFDFYISMVAPAEVIYERIHERGMKAEVHQIPSS